MAGSHKLSPCPTGGNSLEHPSLLVGRLQRQSRGSSDWEPLRTLVWRALSGTLFYRWEIGAPHERPVGYNIPGVWVSFRDSEKAGRVHPGGQGRKGA